eukprot:6011752-Pleurochrysis_carterae.AAC.1
MRGEKGRGSRRACSAVGPSSCVCAHNAPCLTSSRSTCRCPPCDGYATRRARARSRQHAREGGLKLRP